MANNMNSVLMQKKKRMTNNNNKHLSSRRIASATVLSVLSILTHSSSASAVATASTGNGIDDTMAGQHHALHKGKDNASMEQLVADDQRELKKKKSSTTIETSSSAGPNNMPRRPPIISDATKRTHALPLNKKTALHPSSSSTARGGPMMLQNGQLHTPYYPSFTTNTCHNEDDSYPDHYLYDISAYFFHSPRDCCEAHFSTRVDVCMKGTIGSSSSSGSEKSLFEGMGMKKGAYRGGHDMGPTSSSMMGPSGPVPIMAGLGKKKPMLHHDTSWHGASSPSWYGGGGGKSGKAATMPGSSSWYASGKADKNPSSSSWSGGSSWHGMIDVIIGSKAEKDASSSSWSPPSWYGPPPSGPAWHGSVSGGKSSKNGVGVGGSGGYQQQPPYNINYSSKGSKNGGESSSSSWNNPNDWYASSWHPSHSAMPPPSSYGGGGLTGGGSSGAYYNYCGMTWSDANSKCTAPCPSGLDQDCPNGETCFSDSTSCPPAVSSSSSRGNNAGMQTRYGDGVQEGGGMQPIYGDSWQVPHPPPPASSSWHGGGAGKPIRCPPIIPDDDWWGNSGAQEYDDDDDWPSSWSGGGRGRVLQWNYGGNWDSKSNKSAKDAKNTKPSSSWHPPSQPSSSWHPSAGGGPSEPEHHWQAPPDHGPGHHFQVPGGASWQPGSKSAKHTKMSKSKGSKQSSGDSWHPPGGWYPPPPPGGWDPSCFPTSPPQPTRKPTVSPIAMPTYAPTPGGSTETPSYSPTIPPVVPTYSPSNPFPSYGPTGKIPTYAPTSATYAPTPGETVPTYSPSANATEGGMPTYSPSTGGGMPTYSPTKLDVTSALPTFAPTGEGSTITPTATPPTALPTFNPTTPVPSTESPGSNMPTTYMPASSSSIPTTYSPDGSVVPTYSPSANATEGMPTFVPTVSGTETPTYSPSTSSPTMEGNDFWMWGAPEAVGQVANEDVLVPLNLGDTAVHTTAGSKYTIIVLNDGSALASGDIDSLDVYSGYLGLDGSLVKKGINPFKPINQVLETSPSSSPSVEVEVDNKRMKRPRRLGHRKKSDRENNGMIPLDDHMVAVDAPKWAKAFAGVEQTPDSGIIHTIMLDTKGQAWATGSNSVGQLCLGDNDNRMMPERIPIDGIVVDVAIGAEQTLLLLDDGTVYGCGSNAMGQLGLGKKQAGFSPMVVDSIKSPVSSISAGHSHSLFVAEDGIYVTGSNEYGQLCTDTAGQNVITPKALNIEQRVATSFDAIKESSYILYEDGSVNSCGRNSFGQLGDGTEEDNFIVAVQLDGHVVNLLGVGPSAESAFFYTEDERVWGAGRNDRGQLGVGDEANRNLPSYVMFEGPVELDLLSVSEVHTVALATVIGTFPPQTPTYMPSPSATSYEPTPIVTQSPTKTGFTMYFWGSPDSIGQDEPTDQIVPVESGDGVIDVGAGSKYTVMVLQDGTALSTGYVGSFKKYSGHLGIDTPDSVIAGVNKIAPISRVYDADVMTIVDAPMFEKVFAGVESRDGSGFIHTVLLDNKGQAWATGSNNAGQLCMGDSVDQLKIPQRIPVEGSVIDVAIGGQHTLLLLDDGSVYGCGSNAAGQLGLGETTETIYEPTLLDGLAAVSSISAGHSHSLFMAKDGIYFTGSNEFGQLCADTGGENLFSPESIPGIDIKNIVSFEANKEASFILYKDGSVNSCGNNKFGQLGDGTNENQLLAEVELGESIARLVGVGPSSESAFFVSEDEERVYASGLNDRGQLGTGDQENKNVPTFVRFEERVILETISASGDHTVALGYADGTFSPTGSDATDSPTESPTPLGTTPAPTVKTPAPTTSAPSISPNKSPSSSPTIVVPPPTSEPSASPVSLATPTTSPTYVVSPPTLSPVADTDVPTNVFPTLSPNAGTPNPTLSDSPTIGVPSTNSPTPFDGGDSSVPTILVTTEVPTTKSDGATELYYWGAPESAGESGEDKTSPEPTGELFSDVAAGSRYSIKILPDGIAHSMGYIDSIDTYHGHLGLPGGDVSVGENEAKPITSVYDAENDQVLAAPFFVQAFAGAERESSPGSIHTLLIDEDGQAWVTGSNNKGQLCLGDSNDRLIPQQIPIDNKIVGAAVGSEHTLLLLEDGSVYGCGSSDVGQLGLGGDVQSTNIPTLIEGLGTVEGVSAGVEFSLFKADDALYATGSNTYGQLCDEDTVGDDVMSPIGLAGVDASSVSTFESIKTSAFILFKDGSVGACGRNNFGQLGDNTNEDRVRTVIEPLPDDVAIRMLGVGPSSESAFFVNADGVTYATGLNDRGQLGVGDVNNRNALTMVSYGIAAQVPQKISASEDHTLSR